MPKIDEMGFIERQQFFNGQRLVADDLQGLETFHRELRELHNRSLHQPGIGNGYAVSGERGDREVTIGSGYAIDNEGHEIILVQAHLEPVPPVEGEDDGGPVFYYLTVSYPNDEDLEQSETRAGICHPRGVVRLREEPVFCWVRLVRDDSGRLVARDLRLRNDINEGRKILLAQAEVQHCELQKLSIAQRRNARPETQPYITCGRATPDWNILFPDEAEQSFPIFLNAEIDTSEASFLTTPCYSARIQGPRQLHYFRDSGSAGLVQVPFFADALLSIDHDPAPAPDRFQVTLLVFMDLRSVTTAFRSVVEDNPREVFPWDIEWMGVE